MIGKIDNDYVAILTLARYAGLRLEECFRIDTNDAVNAIQTGKLFVKGKGVFEFSHILPGLSYHHRNITADYKYVIRIICLFRHHKHPLTI